LFSRTWGGFGAGFNALPSNWCYESQFKNGKIKWADIDGDGKADMHCDYLHGSHKVRLSNGDGTFRSESELNDFCTDPFSET